MATKRVSVESGEIDIRSSDGGTIPCYVSRPATLDRKLPGLVVMQQIFGSSGASIMAIAILLSTFGCCNGLILAGARVYYAMAQDGLFFGKVGTLHPKYKTPNFSLVVQGIWTCLLCLSGTYGQLLDYIIFAVLVFYILTIAGLFRLRYTQPNADRERHQRTSAR